MNFCRADLVTVLALFSVTCSAALFKASNGHSIDEVRRVYTEAIGENTIPALVPQEVVVARCKQFVVDEISPAFADEILAQATRGESRTELSLYFFKKRATPANTEQSELVFVYGDSQIKRLATPIDLADTNWWLPNDRVGDIVSAVVDALEETFIGFTFAVYTHPTINPTVIMRIVCEFE